MLLKLKAGIGKRSESDMVAMVRDGVMPAGGHVLERAETHLGLGLAPSIVN